LSGARLGGADAPRRLAELARRGALGQLGLAPSVGEHLRTLRALQHLALRVAYLLVWGLRRPEHGRTSSRRDGWPGTKKRGLALGQAPRSTSPFGRVGCC